MGDKKREGFEKNVDGWEKIYHAIKDHNLSGLRLNTQVLDEVEARMDGMSTGEEIAYLVGLISQFIDDESLIDQAACAYSLIIGWEDDEIAQEVAAFRNRSK